jgi:putative SOS response-associated peptidase YedK
VSARLVLRDAPRRDTPVLAPGTTGDPEAGQGGVRIRCPRCRWEHDFRPWWQCERCLVTFDTFLTRAHCPSCDNSWRETWCPKCHRPSPHEAWYVHDDGPSA